MQITIPLRFIFLTAHFISVLAVVFGAYTVTAQMTGLSNGSTYNKTYNQVTGFAYAALACFGVEYITLFLGVSLFIRPMMTLNIVAHFVGLILVILLYYDNWSLAAWQAFVVVFNFVPMLLELFVLGFMSRFTYARY